MVRTFTDMSKRLAIINITLVITDLILSGMTVAAFAWAAWHFSKWWLVLFTLIPVMAYSHHSIIIESDIQQDRIDKLGGDKDSN